MAYAIAGTVDIDLATQPLGQGSDGQDVYLKTSGQPRRKSPTRSQLRCLPTVCPSSMHGKSVGPEEWQKIESAVMYDLYEWDTNSTYVQEPPLFVDMPAEPAPITAIEGARCLVFVGDSTTTDHISPAGNIKGDSPAGKYPQENGVKPVDFNTAESPR
ncbi:MAG: hypothetical protein R3C20_10220 [Planctomycetaceae bacterium]